MTTAYLLKRAEKAYYLYRKRCGDIAKEAQTYIDWDNNVGCEYLPSDGLCILATVSDKYSNGGMPESVCPAGAYVIGKTSTNTIEGFWGHLKRVLKSTYHWVSPKHLQGYVDAETFRYNTKHLSDCKRFDVFLQNVYHTFTYKDLIAS